MGARASVLLAALALAGCRSGDYTVESRETPVHVWVSAPEVGARGGQVDLLVYVGGVKAVEGPVCFPRGVCHVALPTVYVPSCPTTVTAVVRGDPAPTTKDVQIGGESWIQVVVSGGRLEIRHTGNEPPLRN
jgi:hypothetical protein